MMFPLVLYPPYFEAVYCFICGRRRVAVVQYRMISLVLNLFFKISKSIFEPYEKLEYFAIKPLFFAIQILMFDFQAKSRKYQGVFEVKSRLKTWQVRGINLNNWSISKSQNGGRNQVSGRVSVPCWLATPVANAPWKPLIIR